MERNLSTLLISFYQTALLAAEVLENRRWVSGWLKVINDFCPVSTLVDQIHFECLHRFEAARKAVKIFVAQHFHPCATASILRTQQVCRGWIGRILRGYGCNR